MVARGAQTIVENRAARPVHYEHQKQNKLVVGGTVRGVVCGINSLPHQCAATARRSRVALRAVGHNIRQRVYPVGICQFFQAMDTDLWRNACRNTDADTNTNTNTNTNTDTNTDTNTNTDADTDADTNTRASPCWQSGRIASRVVGYQPAYADRAIDYGRDRW